MATVTSGSPGLGRVLRSDLPYIDVTKHGIAADGTDQTAKITALFAAKPGQRFYFPDGDYTLASTLTPSPSNDFFGAGPTRTRFLLTGTGNGIQIGKPQVESDNYVQYRQFRGFGIVANVNTVVALRLMQCLSCEFDDIRIVSTSSIGASYIGMRVSGACYLNLFKNIVVEVSPEAVAANGIGWSIGNGQNEVGHQYAATNRNTFINCRSLRYPVGFDLNVANGCQFLGCNAEFNNTCAAKVRGSSFNYLDIWIEEESTDRGFIFDASQQGDGAGGLLAETNSAMNTIASQYPCDVVISKSNSTRIMSPRVNRLTINSTANYTTTSNVEILSLLTDNGVDSDLQYTYGGEQYHAVREGANNGFTLKTQGGGFKLFSETAGNANERFMSSHRFLDLSFGCGLGTFSWEGANPIHKLAKVTTDPGSSPANTAYLFSRLNGSSKMEICARFPSGVVQVISTEP